MELQKWTLLLIKMNYHRILSVSLTIFIAELLYCYTLRYFRSRYADIFRTEGHILFDNCSNYQNARLVELDTLLNIDGKGQAHAEAVVAKSTRTSVLDSLKRPATPRSTDKKPKQHEERCV